MEIKMSEIKNRVLGILGGLGPMSSAYFYEMITAHTDASCDQQHLDIVISSRATTPDRTDYILGRSGEDPSQIMSEEMKKLESYGADVIAIPCNTAHYFFKKLVSCVSCEVLNMVDDTVALCKKKGVGKLGILATEGTVSAGIYAEVCNMYGIECAVPSKNAQETVTRIIYEQIKAGVRASSHDIETASEDLRRQGCDVAVLGCTELSVAKQQLKLGGWYIDALEVLAKRAIEACGKISVGFEELDV